MLEENRTPTRQFVEVGDVHPSGQSASEGEDNLQSQLLDRRMSSSEVDRIINAIGATLATQLETLIQSLGELSEKSSNRSTEGNAISERSRSSGQRSDTHQTNLSPILAQPVSRPTELIPGIKISFSANLFC